MIKSVVLECFGITRRHWLQFSAGKTQTHTHTHTRACPRESAVQHATRLGSVPLLASTDNWNHKMISEI